MVTYVFCARRVAARRNGERRTQGLRREMIENIKANAQMVVRDFGPHSGVAEFGYNRESVEYLEGMLERMRQRGVFEDEEERVHMAGVFGSFLGEGIIAVYGGQWVQTEETWCVELAPHKQVFPFAKTYKQMSNGMEDSVWSFFRVIGAYLKRQEKE